MSYDVYYATGGDVILPIQKTEEKTEEKTEDVENNNG